jgi:hypothetical protein
MITVPIDKQKTIAVCFEKNCWLYRESRAGESAKRLIFAHSSGGSQPAGWHDAKPAGNTIKMAGEKPGFTAKIKAQLLVK